MGRLLARYRVRLGFVAALVAVWLAEPTLPSVLVGGPVAAVGEGLRFWAAGHLEKGREVTVSGPYRWTGHPLYVGSSVMAVGFAVAAASVAVAVMVGVYMALTIGAAIRSEEAHLTEKFGAVYPDYKEGRGVRVSRRFSAERAMRNREYRSLTGVAVALALLVYKVL